MSINILTIPADPRVVDDARLLEIVGIDSWRFAHEDETSFRIGFIGLNFDSCSRGRKCT